MQTTVSKSQFKPQALEFLRMVENTKKHLVITHEGKPVVEVIPYSPENPKKKLEALQGSVLEYIDPSKPIGLQDWEALR